jgi:hypothetical protein
MRSVLVILLMAALAGCDFIGGAETLVRGSNNVIAKDGNSEAVARALAEFEAIPQVPDEELLAIYESIRASAAAGDLESAQVILRLAAIQRAPEEEEGEEGG